uniref:Uncharacterized protein n=1 Tax=Kalanchoe fedtschenkoi TaxID=63787 RepID=A0A7N0T5F2_KALFE
MSFKKPPAVEEEGGGRPSSPHTPAPPPHSHPTSALSNTHNHPQPGHPQSARSHPTPQPSHPVDNPAVTPPLGEAPSAGFSAGRSERLDLPRTASTG